MNISDEKKKILNIYDETTSRLKSFKNANIKNKLCIFIVPITLVIIFFSLFLYLTYNNCIFSFIPFLLLLLPWYIHFKGYDNYIKNTYFLQENQNDDIYYHIFLKKIKENGIDGKKIDFYIDILELNNDSTEKNKINFMGYISLIYIPAFVIYFQYLFENQKQ